MINMQSSDKKAITGAQLRAARALLKWSAQDVADHAGVGVATVRRAERDDGSINTTAANAKAMCIALESAGVQFIPENGGGPGVRLQDVSRNDT